MPNHEDVSAARSRGIPDHIAMARPNSYRLNGDLFAEAQNGVVTGLFYEESWEIVHPVVMNTWLYAQIQVAKQCEQPVAFRLIHGTVSQKNGIKWSERVLVYDPNNHFAGVHFEKIEDGSHIFMQGGTEITVPGPVITDWEQPDQWEFFSPWVGGKFFVRDLPDEELGTYFRNS